MDGIKPDNLILNKQFPSLCDGFLCDGFHHILRNVQLWVDSKFFPFRATPAFTVTA